MLCMAKFYFIYKDLTNVVFANLYIEQSVSASIRQNSRKRKLPLRFQEWQIEEDPGAFSTNTSFEVAARKDFNPVTT